MYELLLLAGCTRVTECSTAVMNRTVVDLRQACQQPSTSPGSHSEAHIMSLSESFGRDGRPN